MSQMGGLIDLDNSLNIISGDGRYIKRTGDIMPAPSSLQNWYWYATGTTKYINISQNTNYVFLNFVGAGLTFDANSFNRFLTDAQMNFGTADDIQMKFNSVTDKFEIRNVANSVGGFYVDIGASITGASWEFTNGTIYLNQDITDSPIRFFGVDAHAGEIQWADSSNTKIGTISGDSGGVTYDMPLHFFITGNITLTKSNPTYTNYDSLTNLQSSFNVTTIRLSDDIDTASQIKGDATYLTLLPSASIGTSGGFRFAGSGGGAGETKYIGVLSNTSGSDWTIQSMDAGPGATVNLNGGKLILKSGGVHGNGTSTIDFYATGGNASGGTAYNPTLAARIGYNYLNVFDTSSNKSILKTNSIAFYNNSSTFTGTIAYDSSNNWTFSTDLSLNSFSFNSYSFTAATTATTAPQAIFKSGATTGTNKNAGGWRFDTNSATGNGSGIIEFYTVYANQGTGTTTRASALTVRMGNDAYLKLAAGGTAAGQLPLLWTSGSLNSTPVAGGMEFLTDKWYGTITTGAARKEFALNDVAGTATYIPFCTTNGRFNYNSGLSYDSSGQTLTVKNANISSLTSGRLVLAGTSGVLIDNINLSYTSGTGLLVSDNVKLTTAGNGLYVKEGTNATMGVATLVAGTVVVNTTKVTANSRIFLTAQSLGTVTVGQGLAVSARTAGTSFTILSQSALDTSTVAWIIVEPA